MKNRIRVHGKGSKITAVSQGANSTDGAPSESRSSKIAGVFSDSEGSWVSPAIDLSQAEVDAIQKDAAERGESMDAWLRRIIGGAVQEIKTNHPLRNSPQEEMESAIDQAQALSALLEHQIFHPEDGVYCGSIQCGIIELSSSTFARLRRVHREIEKGGVR